MKYRILNKAAPPAVTCLTFNAQPIGERGEARGSVLLSVPPGLFAAHLADAIEVGEVWELRLAADGRTILEASRKAQEQEREV